MCLEGREDVEEDGWTRETTVRVLSGAGEKVPRRPLILCKEVLKARFDKAN